MANACAARQLLPPPMQVAAVAATAGAVQGSATGQDELPDIFSLAEIPTPHREPPFEALSSPP